MEDIAVTETSMVQNHSSGILENIAQDLAAICLENIPQPEVEPEPEVEPAVEPEPEPDNDAFEGFEIYPQYDLFPEHYVRHRSLADMSDIKQDIMETCEMNAPRGTTLADVMGNNASATLACNFLAALTLAGEGKLSFDLTRKSSEPLKPEDVVLKLTSTPDSQNI